MRLLDPEELTSIQPGPGLMLKRELALVSSLTREPLLSLRRHAGHCTAGRILSRMIDRLADPAQGQPCLIERVIAAVDTLPVPRLRFTCKDEEGRGLEACVFDDQSALLWRTSSQSAAGAKRKASCEILPLVLNFHSQAELRDGLVLSLSALPARSSSSRSRLLVRPADAAAARRGGSAGPSHRQVEEDIHQLMRHLASWIESLPPLLVDDMANAWDGSLRLADGTKTDWYRPRCRLPSYSRKQELEKHIEAHLLDFARWLQIEHGVTLNAISISAAGPLQDRGPETPFVKMNWTGPLRDRLQPILLESLEASGNDPSLLNGRKDLMLRFSVPARAPEASFHERLMLSAVFGGKSIAA